MLSAAKHLSSPSQILRFAQDDNQGCSMRDNRGCRAWDRPGQPLCHAERSEASQTVSKLIQVGFPRARNRLVISLVERYFYCIGISTDVFLVFFLYTLKANIRLPRHLLSFYADPTLLLMYCKVVMEAERMENHGEH